MRIGEMVSSMMTISRNKSMQAQKLQKANMELATGKRVNSASDDPSAIGRIQRTKAKLNETKIVQSALQDGINRNAMMESTMKAMSSANEELASLAVKKTSPGASSADIEAQAKTILDSMVSMMADTEYNGVNPFSQSQVSFRTSGGNSITQDTPKFMITKNESDPTKYDITLNDGTKVEGKTVADILDSDFIQTNLTEQIASATSQIGASSSVLEFRSNFEKSRGEVLTKALSNIEDADLSESAIQAKIAEQMMALADKGTSATMNMLESHVGAVFDVRI